VPGQSSHTVLLATLGSEPQVITLAIDLLRIQGIRVGELVVLHNAPCTSPTQEALATLKDAIVNDPAYCGWLQWRGVTFADGPLADITRPSHARSVFRTLYREVLAYKQAGHTVHLSAAGGRKVMAMYAMLTAQLLFDERDRLWNLVL
jgi:CRISPR-associated protein Csx14